MYKIIRSLVIFITIVAVVISVFCYIGYLQVNNNASNCTDPTSITLAYKNKSCEDLWAWSAYQYGLSIWVPIAIILPLSFITGKALYKLMYPKK